MDATSNPGGASMWSRRPFYSMLGGVLWTAAAWAQAGPPAPGYYSDPRMPNNPRHYMQLSLGRYNTFSSAPASSSATGSSNADQELTWKRSLNTVGFVAQVAREPGDFQYGMEGGAQIGYSSNSAYSVFVSGSNSQVTVRSEHWTGDFFGGGFISARPTNWLRVFASAGPTVYWGRVGDRNNTYEIEDSDGESQIIVDLTDEQEDIGVGVYGRVGLEVTVNRRVNLGVSVRRTNAELDFGERGSTRLDEPAYTFTVGYHY